MVYGKLGGRFMTLDDFYKIISDISKIPIDQIKEQSSFKDDLGIDSLMMVNLIIEVASKFALDLESIESADDMRTVGKMYVSLTKGVKKP
jgi:acyl carrier protein